MAAAAAQTMTATDRNGRDVLMTCIPSCISILTSQWCTNAVPAYYYFPASNKTALIAHGVSGWAWTARRFGRCVSYSVDHGVPDRSVAFSFCCRAATRRRLCARTTRAFERHIIMAVSGSLGVITRIPSSPSRTDRRKRHIITRDLAGPLPPEPSVSNAVGLAWRFTGALLRIACWKSAGALSVAGAGVPSRTYATCTPSCLPYHHCAPPTFSTFPKHHAPAVPQPLPTARTACLPMPSHMDFHTPCLCLSGQDGTVWFNAILCRSVNVTILMS